MENEEEKIMLNLIELYKKKEVLRNPSDPDHLKKRKMKMHGRKLVNTLEKAQKYARKELLVSFQVTGEKNLKWNSSKEQEKVRFLLK